MNPAFDLGVNYQKSPPEILHRFGKNDVRQGQYSTSYIPWTLDFEGGKMQHLPCSRCLLPKTELQKLCGKTSWGQHDKRFERGNLFSSVEQVDEGKRMKKTHAHPIDKTKHHKLQKGNRNNYIDKW